MTYNVTLTGANEVPPVTTQGSGTATVTVDTASGALTVMGTFTGLSSNATAAHIHGPAAPGMNAPVIIQLMATAGTAGMLSGTGTLTPAQMTSLTGGMLYINIHTSTNPAGEIRGQIGAGATPMMFNITLSGANEVPPVTPAGSATATVTLNTTTRMVTVMGTFTGLTSNAAAAHIHGPAAAGANGPVIVTLMVTTGMAGTFSGTGTLTMGEVNNLLNGMTYLNVHTVMHPAGEIRGQIE